MAPTLPPQKWVDYPLTRYQAVCQELVHASVKTVHSNAAAGGVRLSAQDKLALPYISARTLLNEEVTLHLDYVSNSGDLATVVKQINALVLQKDLATLASTSQKEFVYQALASVATHGATVGLQEVDPRVRQILLPCPGADGGYVSVTPITPTALCFYLLDSTTGQIPEHNKAVDEERTALRESGVTSAVSRRKIRRAFQGIGGSNPQNIGNLVRSMHFPVLADAPTRDAGIVTAQAMYHQGIQFRFSRKKLLAYRLFLDEIHREGTIHSTMTNREKERQHLEGLVHDVWAEAVQSRAYLLDHEKFLPQESSNEFKRLVSEGVPWSLRGAIDPRERDLGPTGPSAHKSWVRAFGVDFTEALLKESRRVDGKSVSLFSFDTQARSSLEGIVEDLAWEAP